MGAQIYIVGETITNMNQSGKWRELKGIMIEYNVNVTKKKSRDKKIPEDDNMNI